MHTQNRQVSEDKTLTCHKSGQETSICIHHTDMTGTRRQDTCLSLVSVDHTPGYKLHLHSSHTHTYTHTHTYMTGTRGQDTCLSHTWPQTSFTFITHMHTCTHTHIHAHTYTHTAWSRRQDAKLQVPPVKSHTRHQHTRFITRLHIRYAKLANTTAIHKR